MKNKTWIALVGLLMILVLGCPNTTKAAEISSFETVIQTYAGSVNGAERELIITWDSFLEEASQYIKIGEMDPVKIWFGDSIVAGINQYGAVVIWNSDYSVMCWSYDLVPDLKSGKFHLVQDPDSKEIRYDIESLVFEGSGSEAVVVGYKTFSGEVYPLPSFDELKAIAAPGSSVPEPRYIPKGMEPNTPTPSTPASVTPVPVADTPVPASDTLAPKVNAKKISIKTEKKAKVLYEGDKFIGQYILKKGVLTWKGPKKKGRVTGVKSVAYIKKSKNLVYITKKGAAYTISFKTGKKELIVKPKKKAQKFIYSGKFVTKIKTSTGKVNVSKK